MDVKGYVVDIFKKRVFKGSITIQNSKILAIREENTVPNVFIIPGFVDAHIHIESSLLPPSEFAKIAVRKGCIACICDPHEIANVVGMEGVDFMINNAKNVNFKFYFGAPPCVPATDLEDSGGKIGVQDIETLLKRKEIKFLAEVMDFESVIQRREDIMRKISFAKTLNKPIDGHAPGLRGEMLERYISAGISTDHEVTDVEEAEEKIKKGMKVIIRYGSVSRDFDALSTLVERYPKSCMIGSDDKAPDDLEENYIDSAVKEGVRRKLSIFDFLWVTSVTPRLHYGIDIGLLRVGDPADFVIVENLEDLRVIATYIDGIPVFYEGCVKLDTARSKIINNFQASKLTVDDIKVISMGQKIRVIETREKSLFTGASVETPRVQGDLVVSDKERDILKVVLINRYKKNTKPVVGFLRGFGLKKGSMASSILHDSHHIIGLGCDDISLVEAINEVIENEGGMVFVSSERKEVLPLPIGGLMSDLCYEEIVRKYRELNRVVKESGILFSYPFVNLSFVGLPVIPKLKITSRGLFDVNEQKLVELFL
ncbi:MAG: adenine deaminase [Deltaproteobacteria bacterium]|nr:adenine deaminase [Deltaproteobacteria bacterium]